MTKHPSNFLTPNGIPLPVTGAAQYRTRAVATGGFDVIMKSTDGDTRCVDFKPTHQSALRAAVRWQKRENAAVAKATKLGRL